MAAISQDGENPFLKAIADPEMVARHTKIRLQTPRRRQPSFDRASLMRKPAKSAESNLGLD